MIMANVSLGAIRKLKYTINKQLWMLKKVLSDTLVNTINKGGDKKDIDKVVDAIDDVRNAEYYINFVNTVDLSVLFDKYDFPKDGLDQPKTITIELELSSPYKLTEEQIEKDILKAEDEIGFDYDYKVKSVKVETEDDSNE
jgi:hypothetical protein